MLFEPASADWATPIVVPLALDVIASMVAVNGATLNATSRSTEEASPLVPLLPAGVSYIVPPGKTHLSVAGWFAGRLAEHDFESFVLVSADAIGVTRRLLTTALAVLKTKEHVTGFTPNQTPYLVGLRGSALNANLERFTPLLDALADARQHSPDGRTVESRTRLKELKSAEEFRDIANSYLDCLPRSTKSART